MCNSYPLVLFAYALMQEVLKLHPVYHLLVQEYGANGKFEQVRKSKVLFSQQLTTCWSQMVLQLIGLMYETNLAPQLSSCATAELGTGTEWERRGIRASKYLCASSMLGRPGLLQCFPGVRTPSGTGACSLSQLMSTGEHLANGKYIRQKNVPAAALPACPILP